MFSRRADDNQEEERSPPLKPGFLKTSIILSKHSGLSYTYPDSGKETDMPALNFDEMNIDELRKLKKRLTAEESVEAQEALKNLQAHAAEKIREYAEGRFAAEGVDAPAFYAFLAVFGKTNDGQFTPVARKALDRLTPALKDFDEQIGYAGLSSVPPEKVLKNMEALDLLSALNPFAVREDAGRRKWKYPAFRKTAKLLHAIRITGDDGLALDDREQKTFRNSMLEAAKLEAYLRLSAAADIPTEQEYLTALKEIMDISIAALLVTDRAARSYPLSEEEKEKLALEIENLFQSL